MISFDYFAQALPLGEFLARHGTETDRAKWAASRGRAELTEKQTALLKLFTRKVNLLILAGAWCGDCVAQCPLLEKFAEISPLLSIRYLDRDSSVEVGAELKINGGQRVPVVVFFSEDGEEVARFGEKTLTEYRFLVHQLGGDACGTGLLASEIRAGITQDWLNELERVQWILRLSPRLRRLHRD